MVQCSTPWTQRRHEIDKTIKFMFRGSDEVMYERNSVDMCLNLADHTVINNRLARSKERMGTVSYII